MVRWMSGLVNGLQNRVRRFESATNLWEAAQTGSLSFFYPTHPILRNIKNTIHQFLPTTYIIFA